MSYPVTLATLKRRVLQKANLEGVDLSGDGFIGHPELTDIINRCIAAWYDKIISTRFQGQYYRRAWSFTTTAGTQVYALPPDFYQLISGDVFISTTWKVSLQPYQEEDRNALTGPSLVVGWYGPQVWYQLQEQQISFLTTPSAAYSVTLNYIPVAPRLDGAEDNIDSINSLEEWLVIKAAREVLFKDGQLEARAALADDLQEEEMRILACVPDRDAGRAEVVHDVVSSSSYGGAFNGLGEGWP